MKILILEDRSHTLWAIKEVLETLDDVEVFPTNPTENRDLLDDILHHTSTVNKYDAVLSRYGEIDLFIIDIYLSQQKEREKSGVTFCEYVLENPEKNNNKTSQFIIISNGTVNKRDLPWGENIHFFDKAKEREFLYEAINKKVKELFQLDD